MYTTVQEIRIKTMPRSNNGTLMQVCGTMNAGGSPQGVKRRSNIHACIIGQLLRWFQRTYSIVDRPNI
jgi:hypothetical protein